MIRQVALLAVLALSIGGLAPGPTLARAPAAGARHVIVLSFDGARPDALQRVWPPSLRAQSAASWSARTILPSSTMPSHTSMVSGVGPEIHRVTFNDWQPGQPRLSLPTIFTEVRRAGGTVRLLVAKRKLEFLAAPDLVTYLSFPRHRQEDVIERAGQVFAQERPALLFIHVADPDDAGHRHGWMSEPYLNVISELPLLIARLLGDVSAAGQLATTLLIVTADHGGHGRTHGTALPEDMTIPWVALGGAARAGVTLNQAIRTYDTAATVLAALGLPIPAGWQGRPVAEALATPAPTR
ncbi:MAG: alkaline phosphatase family protein [bacterium]